MATEIELLRIENEERVKQKKMLEKDLKEVTDKYNDLT